MQETTRDAGRRAHHPPCDDPLTKVAACDVIAARMSGREWDADCAADVADTLRRAGYTVRDVDDAPDTEPLLWCESLCCDNPCAGGRRQWPMSAMRDGYCPSCAAARDLTAPRADCGVCGLSLTEAETRTHECPDDPHGDEARGIMAAVVAHGARPHDPRADAPEGALNPRDVQELSLGSIARSEAR